MRFIDINRINFLAGVETSLRDICQYNCIEEDPCWTHGEQFTTPFDKQSLFKEKEIAAAFFNIFADAKSPFHKENLFEACQEIAWEYVCTRFGIDALGSEKLVSLVNKEFSTSASVFIGTGLDGNAYIFIE